MSGSSLLLLLLLTLSLAHPLLLLPCHHPSYLVTTIPQPAPLTQPKISPTLSTQIVPVFIPEFSNHDSQSERTYPPFQPTKKVPEYHQTFAKLQICACLLNILHVHSFQVQN